MTNLVQNLNSLQAEDSSQAGGKAASLARMIQAGLPVPPGLVIFPDAFEPSGISNPAWQKTQKMILKFREKDPLISFAVRSSAISEDSDQTSFAGEYESILNAREDLEVLSAVNSVFESRLTERVKIYSKNRGIMDSHLISVIVQQLVPAECSGVMFTANPLTGNKAEIMINAAWGLGESIVSGQVNTDNILVNKENKRLVQEEIAHKDSMTILSSQGTKVGDVPEHLRQARVLNQQQIDELMDFGVTIERLFGKPMDIEWAYANQKFYILQARPITSLPAPLPPLPAEWKLPSGAYIAMRNNIVEMMIEPLTPLFKTLGLHCVNQSMGGLMDDFFNQAEILPEKIIIPVNEYAYYNGSMKPQAIFKVTFGAGKIMKRMFSGAVERWTEKGRPETISLVEKWDKQDIHSLSNSELLAGAYTLCTAAIDAYGALVSGVIPAAWINEGLFTFVYNMLIKRKNDPKAAVFLLGFDSLPLEADKNLYDLAVWIKNHQDMNDYFVTISSANIQQDFIQKTTPENISAASWGEWQNKFSDHLKKYGHAIYNLDFANPLPADDPEQLIETLKLFLEEKIQDPHQRQKNLIQQREMAVFSTQKRLSGIRKKWFDKRLESAQRFAPLREDGLADIGLSYPLLRQLFLELGNRLTKEGVIAEDEDIFWLEEEELIGTINHLRQEKPVDNFSEIIRKRKAVWKSAKQLSPPLSLNFFPKKIRQGKTFKKSQKNSLKGVAASPGVVRGKARILHGPEDFSGFESGEILITAITTPAWTPLFARAAGVVTDIGGPLSHGSIVAREYGIPAVLGTGNATRRIQNGQMIEVNGNTGIIKLSL